MTEYLLRTDRAITPEEYIDSVVIVAKDGSIFYIGSDYDYARTLVPRAIQLDFPGCTAVPGFIDLHVHGALGLDFYDCPSERIGDVADFFARHGTTTLLATVTTGNLMQMGRAIDGLASYMAAEGIGAHMAGIYLEGPFCSIERRGTFRPEYLLTPDWLVLEPWVEKYRNYLRFVGLAPELPGAGEIIKRLQAHNIETCLCHTDAGHLDLEQAVALGATHITHFYNGMRPLSHRDPGLVGGALARGGVSAELICDFHHVHPMAIRVLMSCLGPDNVCLVTDAMRATGCPPGEYIISEQQAIVRNGKALIGASTLAGSVLTMDAAVRNMLSLGYDERDVLKMATLTPARIAGLEDRGQLASGQVADVVILDSDYRVAATLLAGQVIVHGEERNP